jgi:ATP-binding cassette subfamily B protein
MTAEPNASLPTELEALLWPPARAGEALEALAVKSGLAQPAAETPRASESVTRDPDAFRQWVNSAAAWLGVEAESSETSYAQLEAHLRTAGPALIRLPGQGNPRFIALLTANHRGLSLIAPDLTVHNIASDVLQAALCSEIEVPLLAKIDSLLDQAEVPKRRRARARKAILRERLNAVYVGNCWLLRTRPGSSFWRQLRSARLPRRLVALAVAHFVEYLLWIVAWWLVGAAALGGRLDRGWMLAWVLLLLTLVPLRLVSTWLQGVIAIGAGGLLKLRLLAGALRLDPEELRHQGAGHMLGRVMDSEAVESLALSGGFLALVAAIELVMAAVVLDAGAGGGVHVLLLVGWVALTLVAGWRYFQDDQRWTEARLEMTHDLVERMVGHRTRLAQQSSEHWHNGEDQALEGYYGLSARMDRSAAWLMAFVPRGWMLVGLAGIAPAFISGRGTPAGLAVALGGILLAFRALMGLATGLWNLVGAAIAWKQVAPLFHAAARAEMTGSPSRAIREDTPANRSEGPAVVEAHDLVFRYRERGEPVLRSCSLRISAGDRILLEGPSGGGKSTLASLLTGLRSPESGLLLAGGLDRQTLGSQGWRRRVAAAPQFHENHVLTATFAFNAVMGRERALQPGDLEEVETICGELGLTGLLQRMPAGALQLVGETGWQLSHGERSRLYIARALLQDPELIVLDESLAALDPENLRLALECVLRRARALLVIAHV